MGDKLTPRIYQKVGTQFLATRNGILADRVGLGKTATALWAALAVQENRTLRVLIIMPKNLKAQWALEIDRVERSTYPTGNISIEYDVQAQVVKVRGHREAPREYHLAHYQQFENRSKVMQHYLAQHWDVVIVDEAHNIKNRLAQRSRNIKRLSAGYMWGLTGTVVPEFPQDVWSLLNWVAPDKFSERRPGAQTYNQFISTYMEVEHGRPVGIRYVKGPDGRYTQEPVLRMLREQLKPYILARNLEDVGLQLPPRSIIDVPLEMDTDQLDFYHQVKEQIVVDLIADGLTSEQIDELVAAGSDELIITTGGARFTRLHQAASAPSTFKEGVSNTKLEWLRNYIEGGGEPALILTRYRHTVAVIQAELKRLGADTKGFIVGTWDSLSEGHNFQHLHIGIEWDTTFSRKTWEQGLGRLHRSGQTRPVFWYRLMAAPIDRHVVYNVIEAKNTRVQMIVAWLRGLFDK